LTTAVVVPSSGAREHDDLGGLIIADELKTRAQLAVVLGRPARTCPVNKVPLPHLGVPLDGSDDRGAHQFGHVTGSLDGVIQPPAAECGADASEHADHQAGEDVSHRVR
jgi:hypothetical protein